MKSILLITSLGLLVGALAASGNLSFLKNKLMPEKVRARNKATTKKEL